MSRSVFQVQEFLEVTRHLPRVTATFMLVHDDRAVPDSLSDHARAKLLRLRSRCQVNGKSDTACICLDSTNVGVTAKIRVL